MPETKNLRYCRILIKKKIKQKTKKQKTNQPAQVSGLCGFPLMSYSPKCVTEIYRTQYGNAIFVPFRETHM